MIGVLLYIGSFYIISYLLKAVLNLEMLGGGDEFFFFDND